MMLSLEEQTKMLAQLVTEHGPHMLQIVCLTIGGHKVICLGPVLHMPPLGVEAGTIEAIEFGELVPARLAAKLISGEFSRGMTLQ
jgi:hypothetical protein